MYGKTQANLLLARRQPYPFIRSMLLAASELTHVRILRGPEAKKSNQVSLCSLDAQNGRSQKKFK